MENSHSVSAFIASLTQEFRLSCLTPKRLVDEIEAIIAVFLAILIAHYLHAENIGWAAFSGYMVIRAHFSDTLIRGGLRIIGTVVGALLAYYITYLIGYSVVLVSFYIVLVSIVGVYFALTSRFSYAWLFLAITYAMVAIDALGYPFEEVHKFAITRIVEIFSGTIASIIVSVCSHFLKPRLQIKPSKIGIKAVTKFPHWHRHIALHLLQVALALAPLLFFNRFLSVNDLTQAAITILAVLTVPLANITSTTLIARRNFQRFLGCTSGGILAIACLPIFHVSIVLALFFLCVGIFIGRHIENSGKPFAYIGTQFSLIFLVVLLPDNFSNISADPGIARLSGVIVGIILVQASKMITYPIKRVMPLC